VREKPLFVYAIFIRSTPEQVWAALTDGRFTRDYWGGLSIQSDWKAGSPVRHLTPEGQAGWEGVVIEADPPRFLSYTFHMQISDAHRAEEPSLVTFRIEPMGEMVRLTLTHEHADAGATFTTTMHGWPAIMSSLKSLLETGRPLPFRRLGFGPGDSQEH
jgi:uncharacterized protein YndB with AHSA1/START domain